MKRESGFTLIEVMVAAAVFGLAATALFALFSKSLFNLGKIENVHQYQLASEEVLNRVLMLQRLPPEGRAEGGVEGLDAHWIVTVRPLIPDNVKSRPSQGIVHIGVDVVWPGRSGPRSISLETVKPSPLSYENYDFSQEIERIVPR